MKRTIDMHCHLPGEAFGLGRWPTAEYLAMMDDAGVDQAVVFTVDGLFFDDIINNDRVVEQTRESGGRLIPFCAVNPRRAGAADEVRRCVEELGCRGVKLHSVMQGFSPLQDFVRPIAQAAARLGVPMLLHDGTPPYSTPLQVAYLADQFPDLAVILGHGGGMDLWGEAIAALQRYPNLYVSLCGSQSPVIFERIIRALGGDRVFVATDSGFVDDRYLMKFRMDQFRALDLSDAVREKIFWRNAVDLLGTS